jgi:hypothetical protein
MKKTDCLSHHLLIMLLAFDFLVAFDLRLFLILMLVFVVFFDFRPFATTFIF